MRLGHAIECRAARPAAAGLMPASMDADRHGHVPARSRHAGLPAQLALMGSVAGGASGPHAPMPPRIGRD